MTSNDHSAQPEPTSSPRPDQLPEGYRPTQTVMSVRGSGWPPNPAPRRPTTDK